MQRLLRRAHCDADEEGSRHVGRHACGSPPVQQQERLLSYRLPAPLVTEGSDR